MANEGDSTMFTCVSTGDGPRVLQVNGNIKDTRLARISESDSSSGDDMGHDYVFANLSRADNGTTIQCFVNAVPSNVITVIVDCKHTTLTETPTASLNLTMYSHGEDL